MKRTIFFTVLCNSLLFLNAFSQVDLFVKGSGNLSIIPSYKYTAPTNAGFSAKMLELYESSPGFNLQFAGEKKISDRLTLSSGPKISYISFAQKFEFKGVDSFDTQENISNTDLPNLTENVSTNLFITSLPILLHHTIFNSNFSVGFGMEPSLLIMAKRKDKVYEIEEVYGEDGFGPTQIILHESETTSTSLDGFNAFGLNANIVAQYRLNDWFLVDLTLQQGLTRLYENHKSRLRTVQLGVGYNLN